jgi:AbrB family looped-hinge helix DNA binding protein
MDFEVTKLGERGQVVIPQEFRKSMGLHQGEKFIVMERGDTLILKRLKAPTTEDFEVMLEKGRAHAKKQNIAQKDVAESIKKARMRA